ncbi:MAG: YggS family pyridoxal phosphate-dependent enzyme [Chthoniobacterales bacterium]
MTEIVHNLENIRLKIARATAKARRKPEDVRLIAVSKTYPAEKVREVIEEGHILFGESRVQEAVVKIAQLPSNLQWHFIGHLQKNKVRKALPYFDLIHGVDNYEIAEDINRIAEELGRFPRVLLEVNVSGEGSKFGFKPDQLRERMEALLAFQRIEIHGLMTMAPLSDDAEKARPYFTQLRELRDQLQEEFRLPLPELSMGMSGDYEVAIEEGATLVRVGTAIFGAR